MMKRASRVYGMRVLVVALVAALGIWAGLDSYSVALVDGLKTADMIHVPDRIEQLNNYRLWAEPRLRRMLDDSGQQSSEHLRASLALLPVDPLQAPFLHVPLLEGEPSAFPVIRELLMRHENRAALERFCRASLLNEELASDRRFRAREWCSPACSSARSNEDRTLAGSADLLAAQFVNDLLKHPDRYNDWLTAMKPASAVVVPSLKEIFRGSDQTDGAKLLAATILANFARDLDTLIELLLDASPQQFPVILDALSIFKRDAAERLSSFIEEPAPPELKDKLIHLQHQANAAIGLMQWGDSSSLWPLLCRSTSPDPLLRTYLIDRLARLRPDPRALVLRLKEEPEVTIRRALSLILGGTPADLRSVSWAGDAASWMSGLYRNDPDPGVHSAVEWALRQWKLENMLREPDLAAGGETIPSGLSWYVTKTGSHTMAILDTPTKFRMGSENEPDRDGDENPCTREIPRTIAIATKEVTDRQFLAFDREFRGHPTNNVRPDPDCPIGEVTWLECCKYCRWLSEKEGINYNEMCYPPGKQIKPGMTPYPDYLSRTGYRLPTEAEMEYACRAGARNSRFFGDDPAMLPRYAWLVRNADGRTWPGGLLLPNDFGLFDVLGNVKEWCQDRYERSLKDGADCEDHSTFQATDLRVARGGNYSDRPEIFAANRYPIRPDRYEYGMGFRVARTIRQPR